MEKTESANYDINRFFTEAAVVRVIAKTTSSVNS